MTERMVSPNDLQAAAIKMMLHDKPPTTAIEWAKCVNFWAANAEYEVEICRIMAMLFDCPLSETFIEEIATYQKDRKDGKRASPRAEG